MMELFATLVLITLFVWVFIARPVLVTRIEHQAKRREAARLRAAERDAERNVYRIVQGAQAEILRMLVDHRISNRR